MPVSSKTELLDAYRTHLQKAAAAAACGRPSRIRVAVLDHIHSKTGYLMPVAELVVLLRAAGVEYIYVCVSGCILLAVVCLHEAG
jgi:selenocysteine lyase/cysteine desulfurase